MHLTLRMNQINHVKKNKSYPMSKIHLAVLNLIPINNMKRKRKHNHYKKNNLNIKNLNIGQINNSETKIKKREMN